MKPTKLFGSRRGVWEPPCISNQKQYKTPTSKDKNKNVQKLKTRNSEINNEKLKNVLKPEAGEGKKSKTSKKFDYSKNPTVNQNTRNKNEINTILYQNNFDSGKKVKKISSKTIFRRKFSKYSDVQRNLKVKFKSSYKSSGKFDQNSTKYKAYINSKRNKKNKSLLKYSMCSSSFIKKIKNKKRTKICPDLPGKGTYNHRFAYDDALKLHQEGNDVDLLYKVKNKTDSIYVINGEFVWTKSKRSSNISPPIKDTISQKQMKDDLVLSKSQKSIEEEALWLEDLAKIQKANENKKMRLTAENLKLRKEEFLRKQNMREIEKKLRAKQLSKMLTARVLKEHNKLNAEKNKNIRTDKKQSANNEGQNKKNEKKNDLDVDQMALRRLKFQQNLALYKKNNKNITNDKLKIIPENASCRLEVITDSNIINDIERWVLRNDGTVRAISWLKIVTKRIDSLDGRVDKLYTDKWIRMAMDEVVDVMTGTTKTSFNKNIKSSPSFVVKNKRTQCHKQMGFGIRKSPKFCICPGAPKLYKVIKMNDGSYFQVISTDAFGLGYFKEGTN